jgi:NAD(P)-dependent dehydrogenase (short-subunit alcohol dehydrogenase family)
MDHKVALITGGASGMGLAVATALSQQKHTAWTLHLIDLNASAGASAASSPPNAHFHETNVTDYASLSSAFENTFKQSGRIDFVYANAGIVERDNFYEKHEGTAPPPEPNQLSIDINFKSVVNTSYLALHYFRLTKERDEAEGRAEKGEGFGKRGPALVMTASCGGLYPSEFW